MNGFPDTPPASCPFCARLVAGEVVAASDHAAAVRDAFPISPGHTLVVPRRHIADWFELTVDERDEIMGLASAVRDQLAAELSPDGWNIGVNVGVAGGQTVGHVHLHLIPRFGGDRPNPRGGVRWILPDKAAYWEK